MLADTCPGETCAHLDLMGQRLRRLLHDQVDVAQRHILDLALGGQQRDQGRRHLLVQAPDQCLVLNRVQLPQNDLHARMLLQAAAVLGPPALVLFVLHHVFLQVSCATGLGCGQGS